MVLLIHIHLKLETSTASYEDDFYNGRILKLNHYKYVSPGHSDNIDTYIYAYINDYDGSNQIAYLGTATSGGSAPGSAQWSSSYDEAKTSTGVTGTNRYTDFDGSAWMYYEIIEDTSASVSSYATDTSAANYVTTEIELDYQSSYNDPSQTYYDPMASYFYKDSNSSYESTFNLTWANRGELDDDKFKMMEYVANDSDALNPNEFDASEMYAYNWDDYFKLDAKWRKNRFAFFTPEYVQVGYNIAPSATPYCALSVKGTGQLQAGIFVQKTISTTNIKTVSTNFKNTGYTLSQGCWITGSDLENVTLSSTIGQGKTNGFLKVEGTSELVGNVTIGDGYSNSGASFTSATGDLSTKGGITVDLTSTLTGNVTFGDGYAGNGATMTATTGSLSMKGDFTMDGTTLSAINADASFLSQSTLSDINLKTNIISLYNYDLSSLRPVEYNWNWDPEGKKSFGFVAQEVKVLYPNMIKENKEGILSLDYIQLVPLLVKNVQEQKIQIENNEKRIDSLEAIIKQQEEKINMLFLLQQPRI